MCSAGASSVGEGSAPRALHAPTRACTAAAQRLLERVVPRTLPPQNNQFFFFRFLPTVSVVLFRDYPIEYPSKDGQKSKFLNWYKGPLFNTLFQLVQHELLWIHPGCPARSHPRCARAVQHEGRARALLEARGARRCTASRRDPNPNSSPRI